MTDEAHGYNSEDAPVRPASTRWSEDPAPDDDALAPPYVPGRRSAAAASDEDFPFDQFDIDGDLDADTAAPESTVSKSTVSESAASGSEVRQDADAEGAADLSGATEAVGSESDEMGWSPDDLDDGDDEPFERDRGRVSYAEGPYADETYAEQAYSEEASTEDPYAEETYGEWTPGYEDDDDASAVDAELEPIADESPVEEVESAEVESAVTDAETEHRFEPDGSIATASSDERVEEVAAVLDRLAGILRDEGEEAVRREMESPDRLTALVSSLLSGHLSRR